MADIQKTAAQVTELLMSLADVLGDGTNIIVTSANIGSMVANNVSGIVSIANGGTGGSTAAQARANLGAASEDVVSELETTVGDMPRIWFGTSTTAEGTAAKTVTCENFELRNGDILMVSFSQKNTASNPTFNVNGTGAKSVIKGSNYNYAMPIDHAPSLYAFRVYYRSSINTWYYQVIETLTDLATTTTSGLMSANDKASLNNVVQDVAELETSIPTFAVENGSLIITTTTT